MRSGCRGFESRSGHLIFSSTCSVYIDRHIRVYLSDDEQCSKYAVLRTMCMVYTFGPMSMCLDDQQKQFPVREAWEQMSGNRYSFVANFRLTLLWLPR